MSQYCKFYKQKKQVSYDSGATWQDVAPAEYQKGDLYDPYSVDCGARILERWVNNGTICSGATGFDKYYYQVKQESYDNGTTWATTTDYRLGELIEANSPDCLYNPPSFNGKWVGYYNYGNVFSQGCDENNPYPPYIELSYENVHSDSTFNYSSLSSATVGDCVTTMYGSFAKCSNLNNVYIGSGVTRLYDYGSPGGVFGGCRNLKRINSNIDGIANIPSSVTIIGQLCFEQCENLTTINIPSGVTNIGVGAFAQCKSLTGITIPNSVTEIGSAAFKSCRSLSSATLSENITIIEEETFRYCEKLTGITIPNSVTSIGGDAFENCYNLSSVTIPNSVTEIGGGAFRNCTVLTSVTIGSGVTEIGSYAFSDCISLEGITVLPSIPPTLSGSGLSHVFDNTNNCPIYVPCNTINTYKATAGWSMYADRIVAIPNSCTFQGKFKATYTGGTTYSADCDSNTTLTTADTKPSGYDHSLMTDAVIGDCVTSIGSSVFNSCRSLTSIDIPIGVTSIGTYAFQGCINLASITVNATTPPTLGSSVFYNTNNCPIYVPASSVETYKSASRWSNYASRIQAIQ